MNTRSLTCTALQLFLRRPAAVLGQATTSPFCNLGPKSSVEYEGTLLCFRYHAAPSPENRARCVKEGHVPLFKRADVHLYKFMGSTHAITAKLASTNSTAKRSRSKGPILPRPIGCSS